MYTSFLYLSLLEITNFKTIEILSHPPRSLFDIRKGKWVCGWLEFTSKSLMFIDRKKDKFWHRCSLTLNLTVEKIVRPANLGLICKSMMIYVFIASGKSPWHNKIQPLWRNINGFRSVIGSIVSFGFRKISLKLRKNHF